jgi:hypothetical protein
MRTDRLKEMERRARMGQALKTLCLCCFGDLSFFFKFYGQSYSSTVKRAAADRERAQRRAAKSRLFM